MSWDDYMPDPWAYESEYYGDEDDDHTFGVEFVQQTNSAVLFVIGIGKQTKEQWFPKSVINNQDADTWPDVTEIAVAAWFCDKNNL